MFKSIVLTTDPT